MRLSSSDWRKMIVMQQQEGFGPWKKRVGDWLQVARSGGKWILMFAAGVALAAFAFAILLAEFKRIISVPIWFVILGLQFLPWPIRVGVFGGAGFVVIAYAALRLARIVLHPLLPEGQSIASVAAQRQRLGRGPRVVAIGGGTGLATLLRGLKAHSSNITAIVTVADDGGSSGRLRRDLGVMPPGDFRNCITALADDETLLTQLFRYRFGDDTLDGHSFGNLFITALADITGSFERGLQEASKVLAIRGRVVPSTLQTVTLCAEVRGGDNAPLKRVLGEASIPGSPGRIERVYLEPDAPAAYPVALQAILAADLIVAGPGSLYTSILPNLLLRELADAVRNSAALKVQVCNMATQLGETDGFTVADHVRALQAHTGDVLFANVLANENRYGELLPNMSWVELGEPVPGCRTVAADLCDGEHPWRHDSTKLAEILMGLLGEVRTPV